MPDPLYVFVTKMIYFVLPGFLWLDKRKGHIWYIFQIACLHRAGSTFVHLKLFLLKDYVSSFGFQHTEVSPCVPSFIFNKRSRALCRKASQHDSANPYLTVRMKFVVE